MASRHSDVEAKKLRPIYDALDAKNYKGSLKLCSNVLQKISLDSETGQTATALKALTLQRLGKIEEAEQLCQQLKHKVPTDETVLNTLYLVYKSLHKLEEVTQCYEAAYAKQPKNEQLLQAIFHSYVRRSDFQKMNQTAMKLYKTFPKDDYLFWAVQSMLLQAQLERGAPAMLVQLAERLMQTALANGTVRVEDELLLYLDILSEQGQHTKLLELINDARYKTLFQEEAERLRLQATTHAKLLQWPDANLAYKTLLLDHNADGWDFWTGYFDSGFAMNDSGQWSCEQAAALINELRSRPPQDGLLLRGPSLAQLELCRRRMASDAAAVEELPGLVAGYFEAFADRPICAADLSPYVGVLPPEPLLAALRLAVGPEPPADADVRRRVDAACPAAPGNISLFVCVCPCVWLAGPFVLCPLTGRRHC
eukprot:TRINITY_DN8216_c0_g2_i2.p1 TRINITY_DN8216_c0_g2~~TRINITY_DN8216_c0_g2_i2.p1  ORF type:complete len:424 (-),score=112.76 TRINITY_DN8216_c0_g2_i2:41-1312(-)